MRDWRKPVGVKLPPVGSRVVPSGEPLSCGHYPLSDKDLGKPVCYACWLAEESSQIEAAELEYGLTVQIRGKSEKQIFAARKIRAIKVSGIAARIADGTHTDKLLEKLDEFRTQTEAKWFFHQRFFKTQTKDTPKTKRARAAQAIVEAAQAALKEEPDISD